jgi:general secretion pathway protein J
MVAVTLLSMMVLSTAAAIRTLGNTKSTLDGVTNRIDEVRSVSDFLRNSLNAAMPVVRVGAPEISDDLNDGYGTYFYGDQSQLLWVAPFVAGANLGGVYVMHLAHREDRLELRWHPYQRDALAIDWVSIEPRVLAGSVTAFDASYLPRLGAEWEDVWLGGHSLPLAVRLNVQAGDRYWPELIMNMGGARMNLR